jgi:hypothetical protein
MTKVVSINERGTLTLTPRIFGSVLASRSSGQVVVEETDDGLLLRLGADGSGGDLPPPKRLAEFERNNESALAGFNLTPKTTPKTKTKTKSHLGSKRKR